MDEGSCLRYMVLWYYHQEANACRPFIFGGCGGNANQFPSKRKCELRCKRMGAEDGQESLQKNAEPFRGP